MVDRFDEAVATATDGLKTARDHGLERRFGPHFQAAALDALFRAGRWDEAMELAATATKGRVGAIGAVYRDAARARLVGARGERTAARATIDPLAAIATDDIDADVEAFVRLVDAELAIEEERPERATTSVTAGLTRLAEGDDTVLVGPLCAVGLRAAADRAERARALRRPADVAAAEADGGGPARTGGRVVGRHAALGRVSARLPGAMPRRGRAPRWGLRSGGVAYGGRPVVCRARCRSCSPTRGTVRPRRP